MYNLPIMCGIAGYTQKADKDNRIDKNVLMRMLQRLKYRGPDHQKTLYEFDNISIGYTRFAVSDFQRGKQPFYNEGEDIACFLNGEIYNWREIKHWLSQRGHKLETNCDGEILPHLYEEYGIEFPTKLEGMYAIVAIDPKKGKLILIRDRVGEKPLYYSLNTNFFLFASDIPAILASKLVPKDLDLQSIAEFFTFRCIPHTNTILKSINRLEPDSILIFDYGEWKLSHKIYWKPEIVQPQIISEKKATEELGKLLFNSVKLRTETDQDLKLGSALSGGIDSSTITALSKKFLGNRDFHTFSVHVKDDPEDLTAIETVVKRVKTNHHWIDCNRDDIVFCP